MPVRWVRPAHGQSWAGRLIARLVDAEAQVEKALIQELGDSFSGFGIGRDLFLMVPVMLGPQPTWRSLFTWLGRPGPPGPAGLAGVASAAGPRPGTCMACWPPPAGGGRKPSSSAKQIPGQRPLQRRFFEPHLPSFAHVNRESPGGCGPSNHRNHQRE